MGFHLRGDRRLRCRPHGADHRVEQVGVDHTGSPGSGTAARADGLRTGCLERRSRASVASLAQHVPVPAILPIGAGGIADEGDERKLSVSPAIMAGMRSVMQGDLYVYYGQCYVHTEGG